jgi:ribosomal protein L29
MKTKKYIEDLNTKSAVELNNELVAAKKNFLI